MCNILFILFFPEILSLWMMCSAFKDAYKPWKMHFHYTHTVCLSHDSTLYRHCFVNIYKFVDKRKNIISQSIFIALISENIVEFHGNLFLSYTCTHQFIFHPKTFSGFYIFNFSACMRLFWLKNIEKLQSI